MKAKAVASLLLAAAVTVVSFLSPTAASAQDNVLRTNDRINLKIAGVPPNDQALVSGIYTIGTNGMLNLPHLGDRPVQAAGLSRGALEKRIEAAYRDAQIYTRPTIIINVDADSATTRIVTVIGEVKATGPVAYRENMTLLEAIASAGGRTDFASMKNIGLVRGGRTTSHDLTKVASNPRVDVKLLPGDKIIVRERSAIPFFGN